MDLVDRIPQRFSHVPRQGLQIRAGGANPHDGFERAHRRHGEIWLFGHKCARVRRSERALDPQIQRRLERLSRLPKAKQQVILDVLDGVGIKQR